MTRKGTLFTYNLNKYIHISNMRVKSEDGPPLLKNISNVSRVSGLRAFVGAVLTTAEWILRIYKEGSTDPPDPHFRLPNSVTEKP
ncbi:hypothetical protein GWI33_019769 [Rhynchophorus ferrugineus]|uniref:Uncharacterized protein n=1 Tax=Rhynchophorus ferrugineus TaxID=354439 RepID=A0A834HT04_RHYFE|nr:hypothetical protein GWI33_019769 [Rhynchophorus ferrugineus]